MTAGHGETPESSRPAGHPARARLPIVWLSIAIGLTVIAIAVVAVLAGRKSAEPGAGSAGTTSATGPPVVGEVDAPGSSGKYCATLMSALPKDLSGLSERTLADPTPGVAAWGDPAVVLRCGLTDPVELTCSSALEQISGVAWLALSDQSGTTFVAADRPVRIAVTIPASGGGVTHTGPIQQLSETIAADLPPRNVCSSGTLVPPDNG
jgi:hypothetical protein